MELPKAFDDVVANVKGLVKQGFSKKADSVVGIDIGSSAIKVVQLKKEFGKVVLQTYGAVALGPYSEMTPGDIPNLPTDQLITAIQDTLRESNVSTKTAAMSIQASASLLFVLDLPHVKEREVAVIVPNEARKYIPVPLSEVSLDWWRIPKQEYTDDETTKEKTEVLVAAIRNETIQQYRDLANGANVASGFFEIEVFSNIRSTFHHELAPVALIDMGAASTRVAVVEYGVVKTFHTINRGSHYFTQSIAKSLELSFKDAEQLKKEVGMTGTSNEDAREVINTGMNYIFSEINSVLFNYQKEYRKSVGKIILTGGGSRIKGFFERAQSEFSTTVVYGDPFQKAESPKFLEAVLTESGPEFAVAVGLALKQLQ